MLKLMKYDHFLVFLAVWVLFPKIFFSDGGEVKAWLMLEVHEMIRLPHVVLSPIVFILFYERDLQGGVLKVIKNDHFLVFLAVWALFPKVLGGLRSGLY